MDDFGGDVYEKKLEKLQEEAADNMLEHMELKKLHHLLEGTVDSYLTCDGRGGALFYHAFVCIFAHRIAEDEIYFGVLHPADDLDICPANEPAGFYTRWDFDVVEISKKCRRLAQAANELYKRLGIGSELDATVTAPKSLDGFLDGLDPAY